MRYRQRKQVIVNADDFGLTTSINLGIAHACDSGAVTSVSLMANGAAFSEAVDLLKKRTKISVGVHLTLDEEVPLLPASKVPSLVTPLGRFHSRHKLLIRLFSGQINREEVEREWEAQITRVLNAGLPISHLDGHGHVHVFPGLVDTMIRLAKRYHIERVRYPRERIFVTRFFHIKGINALIVSLFSVLAKPKIRAAQLIFPDGFFGISQAGRLSAQSIRAALNSSGEHDVIEIMTHPGYVGADNGPYKAWGYDWEGEFDALKEVFASPNSGVRLTNFRDF